ncbi:hypothetical protein N7G274_006567 [Stereocaulon virgatum]|uniref:Uncharacterized protein n=1 Tax=Stereocaulon virgatum TaxID=373712 RepID=A0ABR4A4J7_9LECA
MADSPWTSPFASPNFYPNLTGIGNTSTGWQQSAVISPPSRPRLVPVPHGNITNRTGQVSIRRNADGSIQRLTSGGRSRAGTLPSETEGMFFPARYFVPPFEPLPVAYYRQECQNDGEIILSELEDALAKMKIDIAEDMRHEESMLKDNSETSWDNCDEALESIPLVEDSSTEMPSDGESRTQGDEPTENNSTATLPDGESEVQNDEPTEEEDNAELKPEEESTIQDNSYNVNANESRIGAPSASH